MKHNRSTLSLMEEQKLFRDQVMVSRRDFQINQIRLSLTKSRIRVQKYNKNWYYHFSCLFYVTLVTIMIMFLIFFYWIKTNGWNWLLAPNALKTTRNPRRVGGFYCFGAFFGFPTTKIRLWMIPTFGRLTLPSIITKKFASNFLEWWARVNGCIPILKMSTERYRQRKFFQSTNGKAWKYCHNYIPLYRLLYSWKRTVCWNLVYLQFVKKSIGHSMVYKWTSSP